MNRMKNETIKPNPTMKNLLATATVAAWGLLFPPLSPTLRAQGTADDYRRAYSLYGQFRQDQVEHWAHGVEAHGHQFSYYTDTPQGRQWHTVDAETLERRDYATEDEMRQAAGGGHQRPGRRKDGEQGPLPRKERHWMEVDEEDDVRPVASPDGRWEAYVLEHNIVVHEKGTPYTTQRRLTQDGTIGLYYSNRILWSPDGRRLLVMKRRPVEKRYVYYVESSPSTQEQPLLHKQEYAKPGDEVAQHYPIMLEVATGKATALPRERIDNQYDLWPVAWTADGSEALFLYNQRSHKLVETLAMDTLGTVRTVNAERAETFVNYSRHWTQLIRGGSQMLFTSERDNWNHLYLTDVQGKKSGQATQLTRGEWCVRDVVHVDDSTGVVWFTASGMNSGEDPYQVHYYRMRLDGKELTCLTPEDGEHEAVFTADRLFMADSYSRPDQAPVTVLRSATTGELLDTLETADISLIRERGWRAPERFAAPGRDGKTLMYGLIQRPTNFDPSKSYPVIEYIYAGPGSAYTPKSFKSYNWEMTSLAELGFIVVQLDAMGTSWRGKAFEETCYKNLQDAGFPDRMAWIRAAAERYPEMDTARVGIYGCSAGGQESTTAVLLHGDFYKAAYSACGCHDNRMDKIWWNEQWMGWPVDSSYVRASNVYNAHRLRRPLMLVVGELDDNVDPASTMQVAAELIRHNLPFELVVIPGAHHTMGETYGEHKRFDFFVKNLMGVEPPKWSEVAATDEK